MATSSRGKVFGIDDSLECIDDCASIHGGSKSPNLRSVFVQSIGGLFLSAVTVCPLDWRLLRTCAKPLHGILVSIGFLVVAFVAVFAFGSHFEAGAAWWFVRPQTKVGAAAFQLSWSVLLPLLWISVIVGGQWVSEVLQKSPQCLARHPTPFAIVLLLVLVGIVAFTYTGVVAIVWYVARCLRLKEASIGGVIDEDLVNRWGRPRALDLQGGLLPDVLAALPVTENEGPDSVKTCMVCLEEFQKGDRVRKLPWCGHTFHRACVDLWLLRCSRCPCCNKEAPVEDLVAPPPVDPTIHCI